MSFSHEINKLRQGLPPREDDGIFGASISPNDAALVMISVPWDVTCSYGSGSSFTPEAIVKPSHQLDFASKFWGPAYEMGLTLLPPDPQIKALYEDMKKLPEKKILGDISHAVALEAKQKINAACSQVNDYVYETAMKYLKKDKYVGVLGGDHSTPLGLLRALGDHFGDYAVLHLDAHHDLRVAYEGHTYSHASIMYNALNEIKNLRHIVQVGIRDYSRDEAHFASGNANRISVFYDADLFQRRALGETWATIAHEIVSVLPTDNVYISCDIDGLSPFYGPSTGTPVPGGLDFNETLYLFEELIRQQKKIIGFDLCEVVPPAIGDWDLNIGARLLYRLCCTVYQSQGFDKKK